jgi:hypothetical protein
MTERDDGSLNRQSVGKTGLGFFIVGSGRQRKTNQPRARDFSQLFIITHDLILRQCGNYVDL